jgi:uncharacterized protein involved in exopolysaccharide biosynthesis
MEPIASPPRTQSPRSESDVSFLQIVSVILRHWRLMVILPLFLAVATGVWMLSQPRQYSAMLSFIPTSDQRSVNVPIGLARQFGVDLGGGSDDQSPQFYVGLLLRPTTLRKAVETMYEIPTPDGGTRRGTMIDFFDLGKPKQGAAWHEAVLHLRRSIIASVDRQSGVIQVTVSALSPALAEQAAQRLLEIVTEFNLTARQKRAAEEARFVGNQLEQGRDRLRTAEDELQSFLNRNREFRNSPELSFQHDRLERNVAMRQEVYTSLLTSHEQSRIDALRDTPLLTVIDYPAGSAQPVARGTVLRVMLAVAFGLSLAAVLALLLELSRGSDARSGMLGTAIRDTWTDMRDPRRWFRRPHRN